MQEKLLDYRKIDAEQATLLERVLHNCKNPAIPAPYQDRPDDYNHLVIQNDRLGIAEYLTFRAATGLFFSPPELEEAVNRLVEAGDLLARKVRISLDRMGLIPYFYSQESQLVERLVARKLTEKEYYGYFSGRLSIGRNYETGEPVYLLTLQKPEPEPEEPPKKRRWKLPSLRKKKRERQEKPQKKRKLWRRKKKE